ncbi:MAG: PilW family protein [Candidatus Accumulibacter sp.]|uniref:PilW family protein n=1 Tax=Accumulibacter sp. TaxID=2053492 RepID=UPI00258B8121|nr:PilW family protein [Accumulibacter sp.]MBK8113790.1 PilW family protein [Accumulibacter sp.]
MATPRGFTLVEVMVAMVIGMIGIIIMMQVFASAEGQKRTTTGTGDAQSNGAMAIYTLQRDIREAGYGFNAMNALGCPLALPAPASRTLTQLAPVIINPLTAAGVPEVPAGDDNTDTLLVAYGNGEGSPEGEVITAINDIQLAVQASGNYHAGDSPDRVIAAPSAPLTGCSLTLATVSDVVAPNVSVHGSGAVDGGTLFNLGNNPRILAYAVRAGNLTVCDYLAADCGAACTALDPPTCSVAWVPIANNIVSLRAQYGHFTPTPPTITWDRTTPQQPTPPDQENLACQWARASALRIAVVARNSQVDQGMVTALAPVWAGSDGAAIDLSDRANWQNYRYKVFETVIPLRNLGWMAPC